MSPFLLLPGINGWEVVDASGELPAQPLISGVGALPERLKPVADRCEADGPTPLIPASQTRVESQK